MGLLSNIFNNLMKLTDFGSATLKSAYLDGVAPNVPGVYKIIYRGKLMKVGKAEDGLRKRFSDYYRGIGGGTAGLKYITEENRDDIIVQWRVCPLSQCRLLEKQMYDQAKANGEEMPWSDRR